ncbi:MAG: iron-containing alcohol dehydrogenase, partial [Burkholderiaceae bacterium]|nr:iron-containing alcohol dehydrogenase [Burkholderiaceae bacterium]
ACVVTDKFLYTSGLLQPALDSLARIGWTVLVISDVQADPPDQVVLGIADRARSFGTEVVIGLGGGSSMDVAKLVAVLLAGGQPLEDMYGIDKVLGDRLPLVQIPTTAGTGSEVTPIAIVTTGATTKSGIVARQLYADMAILDAELTLGLPPSITAATGIDAMVHAIEAFTSARLKNPLSDHLAIKALQLLADNLVEVCRNGANVQAREAVLLGAMLAGQAFANAPVAAVHALAYPLGGVFHLPHGLSNALVLPHVLRFNAEAAAPHYAALADALLPGTTGDHHAKTAAFINHIEALITATQMPNRLRDHGIQQADLPRLAADAMLQTRLLVNNPREVLEADALAIYQQAY